MQSNVVGASGSPGHKSRLGSQNSVVPMDMGIMGLIQTLFSKGGVVQKLIDCLFTDNRWSCTAPVRLGLVRLG